MNQTEQARAAYYARRPKESETALPDRMPGPPWTPKRHPDLERRLTQHKLTLVKMLGGRVAT